mmetsp:Transcript_29492/g.53496  ORF Transcript_29492/g.53496 Transcript_29492/m.53496 type:complete len:472 (-) Transcript_29492:79-1494(-)
MMSLLDRRSLIQYNTSRWLHATLMCQAAENITSSWKTSKTTQPLITRGGRVMKGESNLLLRDKVDLGTVELGLEVVRIPAEKNEGGSKKPNEDGGSGVLGSRSTDDDSVLAHDLDALHEVAPVVVGVLNVKSVLALAGGLVKLLAALLDLVRILLAVVAVVVVLIGRFLAGHALGSDHGGIGVRKALARHERIVGGTAAVIIGELGAGLLGEDAQVNAGSGVGAVSANVVRDLLLVLLEPTLLAVFVVLHLELAALGHLAEFHLLLLFLFVVVVGVVVDAVLHALGHVAVVLADLLVEAIVGVLPVADAVTVLLLVLAGVLLVLLDGLEVSLEVGIHVDDIVSVSGVASPGTLHGARVRGTKAEPDQTLGGNAHVLLVVGLVIPGLGVVASLELEGHVGDPGVIDLVVVGVFETTGGGHELSAHLGGGADGGFGGDVVLLDLPAHLLGGGEAEGGGEDGKSKLHGGYFCCW